LVKYCSNGKQALDEMTITTVPILIGNGIALVKDTKILSKEIIYY